MRAPKLGTCSECPNGLYVERDAKRGMCLWCACKADEMIEGIAAAAMPITREEALAKLRSMAKHDDPELARDYADTLLLRLLNDPEITKAWLAVPKWYA